MKRSLSKGALHAVLFFGAVNFVACDAKTTASVSDRPVGENGRTNPPPGDEIRPVPVNNGTPKPTETAGPVTSSTPTSTPASPTVAVVTPTVAPIVLPEPAPRAPGEPATPAVDTALPTRFVTSCEAALEKARVARAAGRAPEFTPDESAARILYSLVSAEAASCALAPSRLSSATWIDLSRKGLASDVFLPLLVSAKTLLLQSNALTSLSGISGLTQLRVLSLSGNPLREAGALAPLSSLLWLQSLALSDLPLPADALSALAGLGHLERLALRAATVSTADVRIVGSLSLLIDLDLSGIKANQTERPFALLGGLTRLTRIDVSKTDLGDLEFTTDFTNVVEIFAAGNPLVSLPAQPRWSALETLVLADTSLTNIAPFAERGAFGRLKTLILRGTQVQDLGLARRLKALRYLNYEKTPASALKCPLDDWDACEG